MRMMPIVETIVETMRQSVRASLENRMEATLQYPTKAILETLGNIIAENDEFAAFLVRCRYMELLHDVYFDPKNEDPYLRLEVIFNWMNLSAGNQSQVLFDTNILETLIKNVTALTPQADEVCYEAARRSMVVICNFICECSDETRYFLITNNIKALLEGYLAIVQGRWVDEDHDFVVSILQRMNGLLVSYKQNLEC